MGSSTFQKELLALQKPLGFLAIQLTANSEDAKDLLQDTLTKALTYKDYFKEKTNLKAWLYTIMKNTFINNYRRAVKANTILDKTDNSYLLNKSNKQDTLNPEMQYHSNEMMEAISNLHDDFKVPFERHLVGFKYKEIADELNLPIGTVKSRIFHARKQLMVTLKDYK